MLTIDLLTARRFILGKQGLWPGRRHGPDDTAAARTAPWLSTTCGAWAR